MVRPEFAMKICFETIIDDYVAFNRFHMQNSPMWRRQRLIGSGIAPVLVALGLGIMFFSVLADQAHDLPVAIVLIVLFVLLNCAISIPAFFLTRWMMMNGVTKNTRKLLAEGGNRTMLGWREMELVDGRLVVKTDLIHSSLDLRAIQKIAGDDEYTFVYISSIQAYVIPMNAYPDEPFREFIAELREAWDERITAPPDDKVWQPHKDERIVRRSR
jgi:hypothetical protein